MKIKCRYVYYHEEFRSESDEFEFFSLVIRIGVLLIVLVLIPLNPGVFICEMFVHIVELIGEHLSEFASIR